MKPKAIPMNSDISDAIEETGCGDLHEALMECQSQYRDWRKCQGEMKRFKDCFTEYAEKQQQEETKFSYTKM
ncbi:hypothetical protein ROZALSC1DRAFT_31857, partial [Rozella allomycis CSF55]